MNGSDSAGQRRINPQAMPPRIVTGGVALPHLNLQTLPKPNPVNLNQAWRPAWKPIDWSY